MQPPSSRALEAWIKTLLPKDVAFRRIPVPFVGNDIEAKQRLYYALEAMGKVDEFQPKVFQRDPRSSARTLNGDAAILAWAEQQPAWTARSSPSCSSPSRWPARPSAPPS